MRGDVNVRIAHVQVAKSVADALAQAASQLGVLLQACVRAYVLEISPAVHRRGNDVARVESLVLVSGRTGERLCFYNTRNERSIPGL